jgi:hypothetical protein
MSTGSRPFGLDEQATIQFCHQIRQAPGLSSPDTFGANFFHSGV